MEGTLGKKASSVSAMPEPVDLVTAGKIAVARIAPYEDDKSNFDQSHNMSGIACPGQGDWCLMVADELKGLHRFKVDRQGRAPKVSYDRALRLAPPPDAFLKRHGFRKKDLDELDLEAIAEAGDKMILVGSHANKRNTGEINRGAHLVAVADKEELRTRASVRAEWASLDGLFEIMFPSALYQKLQRAGLNIEGATVFKKRLLIGLRSPTRRNGKPGAYVVSTPLEGLLSEDFSRARRHVLPTGDPMIGIRSMETVGDTVLIVTGDSGVNSIGQSETDPAEKNINLEDDDRPFLLRAWKPNDDHLHPKMLAVFPEKKGQKFGATKTSRAKVEGIAVAGRDGDTVSLFAVYDGNDKVFYLPDIKLP
jgi:hypothetical protein